ncbi:4-aminobutyrate--2-oxoglutarate transaminase [Campylobacter geochelonis]|uniref:Acetylornithine aminotransferase / N-succinyl-L, L-diaminopimelate aminotransferase n=1 Tax=Campylobacter geochelonis TaxID=1780362 RepID=A0A128EHW4_9BACT|nr:4-aminobutyrate--2-oxoglutarate transaminase [Campylobacter geochelonis]QKF71509.1 4-aminobutyrate aminotransferase [Campylobacter geochelonis]CZE47918.1 Acetylornithine aminotransferase / N-succinyl-L %2CL-diaminopimelate aminotransferase [Campylobacter geochelonis]CZE48454.1 Acetylornithine aminotransferase / N-succinyl-L %2CL-diaminopimelate aminotransferase [Campylobacter geochelonis]CZE50807.1 Acetylornithine aminotransferase / N-succinyl-L %2CL-diaminopimelate aminotransferase [Campylo
MQTLDAKKAKFLPRGASIMCDWYVKSAKNATITTTDGKEFIDFAGGIGVLNIGHRHDKVVKAVKEQLDCFTHTSFQISPYESYISLAEQICNVVPIKGDKKAIFLSTGAEAVENAVKIARAHTKRSGVIAFTGAFHGRTMMTLALTGKVKPYKNNFGAMQYGVFHALYPSKTQNISTQDAIKSLERIFRSDIAPHDVAAIIFEPVQGEGGFNVAPKDFVAKLREICDKFGIVLIADEVQCGFGRTGKLFAMEHFSEQADIMTMAKSLAGGMVLSGVCGKAEIMDSVEPGGLGGTYAGNPLSTVAALAVLEVFKEEKLLDRSNKLGDELKEFLKSLNLKEASDIRGLGSMVAIEFGDDENPNATFAKKIQENAMKDGLLLLVCGVHSNVIRFLYPLTIEDETFKKALQIFKNAAIKAQE